MNISSSTSKLSVSDQLLKKLGAKGAAKNDGDVDDAQSAQAAANAPGAQGMSKMAELMKKLDSLRTTDPTKFKAVTAEIGKQLKALAAENSGPAAEHLNEMSNRFAASSKTGAMEALRPQQHHQHVARAQGAAAYAKTQSSTAEPNSAVRSQVDSIIELAVQGA